MAACDRCQRADSLNPPDPLSIARLGFHKLVHNNSENGTWHGAWQMKLGMRWGTCLVGLSLTLLSWQERLGGAERALLLNALNSITTQELQKHVDVLADDSFEGREAGSRGGQAAAGYLRQQLEKTGLKPVGEDGGYFQSFGNGCRNILALQEGSDPELKNEIVIIGAHYDHVGYGNRGNSFGPFGYVHNGADDNASGTSGVLEVIDAFRYLPTPPARTILFAFWDGEEKGLLGSKHWVNHPTLPLDRVVFAFNLDMIGYLRNERLEVYGARTSEGLRRLVSEQNRDQALALDFDWEIKPNSDHYSFYERSIPFLMFHTGLHDHYHRPSDDTHLINKEGMQAVSHLLFRVMNEVANAEGKRPFRREATQEALSGRSQLESPSPPAPPRLGVRWDDRVTDRIVVDHVEPDSPAARAGIQLKDELLEVAGQRLESRDHFRSCVLRAPARTVIRVRRESEPEPIDMVVSLAGKPVRVGLSWREDPAERGTVVITGVVAGSPADRAGLKPLDRVYRLNAQPLASNEQLLQTLANETSPVELEIERVGRISTITLQVPPLLP